MSTGGNKEKINQMKMKKKIMQERTLNGVMKQGRVQVPKYQENAMAQPRPV